MSDFLGRNLGLDKASVAHGLRLALAAWLAFAIAVFLNIPHPFWAAMPIWVVPQATRGLLFERAFFRTVGTIAGAVVGLGLLHLPGAPAVPLMVLAGWVAVCAGMTHLLSGVRAYGALLSGMTAGVVVLPTLLDPDDSMERAIARVVCTLIGVLVVTLVTGLFTPKSPREQLYQRARELAGDAVAFAAEAVAPTSPKDMAAQERRILSEMSDLDAEAINASAGSLQGYRRLRHVHALVSASLAVMAAGQALGARRRGEAKLVACLTAYAERLRAPRTLSLPSETAACVTDPRLCDALAQLIHAEAVLFSEPPSADARSFQPSVASLAPPRDWYLARRTGLACGLATGVAGGIGVWSGWSAGPLMALGVCIFAMVLGSMPVPQAIAPKLLAGVGVGVLVAAVYRFAVQPHLTTTGLLLATLLPFLAAGGLARASRLTAAPAVDANMCFLLASQAGTQAGSAAKFINGAAALTVAAVSVSCAYILLPRRAERQVTTTIRCIRRDLHRMLTRPAWAVRGEWHPKTARQLLRLTLHLGRVGELGEEAPKGLLAALNLGHAIARLQHLATDGQEKPAAEQALEALQAFDQAPLAVAERLSEMAKNAGPEASAAIREAAEALRQGASLMTLTLTAR